MIVCPTCRERLESLAVETCRACGFVIKRVHGIPIFLAQSDLESPAFSEYVDHYDALSIADLDTGILNETYMGHQADKFIGYLQGIDASAVCEVGVGRGVLLRKLPSLTPNKVTAVDISLPYLSAIREDAFIPIVANAERLPFQNEFDLLVATDVLEHVLNVSDFLVSANWALKDGGALAVRVPHEDNMRQYARLLGAKYKYAHLRSFEAASLKRLMGQFGFSVARLHYDGFYAYRRRPYTTWPLVQQHVDQYLQSAFESVHDVARIPNLLGRILMQPLEMAVIARKVRTVSSI